VLCICIMCIAIAVSKINIVLDTTVFLLKVGNYFHCYSALSADSLLFVLLI